MPYIDFSSGAYLKYFTRTEFLSLYIKKKKKILRSVIYLFIVITCTRY